jgi:hypothetical protein
VEEPVQEIRVRLRPKVFSPQVRKISAQRQLAKPVLLVAKTNGQVTLNDCLARHMALMMKSRSKAKFT